MQNDVQNDIQGNKQTNLQHDICNCATGDLSLQNDLHDEYVEKISTPDEYYSIVNSDAGVYSNSGKLRSTPALPESCDNSTGDNGKYFPPIDSQGDIGSCVCWAQVYYQYSYAINKKLDREATYENSFSPKFVFNRLIVK